MTALCPTCGADHARRIDWTDYRKGGTGAMSNTGGSVQIIRGNALDLPLADNSVDLVVTSPP